MAFKPNYRFERNERTRLKQAKKEEKRQRREEEAARRKTETDGGEVPQDGAERETPDA